MRARDEVKGKPEGKELKRMLGFIVCRGNGVLYVQPEDRPRDFARMPSLTSSVPLGQSLLRIARRGDTRGNLLHPRRLGLWELRRTPA